MKNSMLDLHNHLFAQLERLGDENLTAEQLEMEINRTKAINDTAAQINDIAKPTLKALEVQAEYDTGRITVPEHLSLSKKDEI